MTVIYSPFKSISEIKNKSEFIKKGKIYPARIIKCSKRKNQHSLISDSNQYAIPTKKGYLIFVENNDGFFEGVGRVTTNSDLIFYGSPYVKGKTNWEGNHNLSEDEFLKKFNELYLSKNGVCDSNNLSMI